MLKQARCWGKVGSKMSLTGAEPGLSHAWLRLKAVTHWPSFPNLDA